MNNQLRKAALDPEGFDFDTLPSFVRSTHRPRVTDLNDFRSRDHKRRVPRDLAWQLGGAA